MFPPGDLLSPFPGVILFISFDHLSGGVTERPIHYLCRAAGRLGDGNMTAQMDAAVSLSIFIFITWRCRNFHSYIFEPIHQLPDGICVFNSWEFISLSAAGMAMLVPCL